MNLTSAELAALIAHPAPDANKYTRGRLVLVGGSSRYPGAACLTLHAAQRMGAGYVQVYCAPSSVSVLVSRHPSAVAASWEDLRSAHIPEYTEEKPAAFVIGPGMDASSTEQARLALKIARRAQAPVLIDGGALGALASGEGRMIARDRASRGLPTVLTPHGGEARRLVKAARLDADEHPEKLAMALALAYDATVVLKGPDTWIADGERVELVTEGSAALAKAGTGDVLAGMIGGLLAQGVAAFEAAHAGVVLHARAGLAAAEDLTDISVVPEDLIAYLPRVLKSLSS